MRPIVQASLTGLALVVAATVPNRADQGSLALFDVPGSTFTSARDINPSGQVVGRYGGPGGTTHGYVRSSDGTFTSIDVPGANLTAALGINAQGGIVGNTRFTGEPPSARHGFLLSNGTFTTIDFPGAVTTNASGINPEGDIVGNYTSPDNVTHGYLLSQGVFAAIDFPDAQKTFAFKITPAGRILGSYVDGSNDRHFYVLHEEVFTTIDLPNGGIPNLDAGGINDQGDIASWYCDTPLCAGFGDIHGFRIVKGEFSTIDVPGLTCVNPLAINSEGDMAGGYSTTAACTDSHGFVLGKNNVDAKNRRP
jgi:uncharacterized membrane protein